MHRLQTYVQDALFLNQQQRLDAIDPVQYNVLERLVTYTKMYELARRFAIAYKHYYYRHCKVCVFESLCLHGSLQIELFSYHKLVLLYGDHRQLVMIVSYKPQNGMFWVNFAQTAGRRWNAHSFVGFSLSERLNRRLDLIDLVNYVLNTDRALNAIYHFAHPRLVVTRQQSSDWPADSNKQPELNTRLYEVDRNCLRLHYGCTHLEFRLLADNKVVIETWRIRDVQGHADHINEYVSVPFFGEFWSHMSNRMVIDVAADEKRRARRREKRRATSPIGGRVSAPLPDTIDSSPLLVEPRSCPPNDDDIETTLGNERRRIVDPIDADEDDWGLLQVETPLISTPQVLVDADALERAILSREGDPRGGSSSPLRRFLDSVAFIARVGAALASNSQITDLVVTPHSIRFNTISLPSATAAPWRITLRFFIDPHEFRMRCQLKMSESKCFSIINDRVVVVAVGAALPHYTDIERFEEYFEQVVAPTCNEHAVLSFLTMSRVSVSGASAAFACLMRAQLVS